MLISAVKVDNFKRIKRVELTLADVTVLIGGNNSGKSSLLQGIHLAITTLQSARSASISASKPVSTLGIDQLIFKPSSDPMRLHHRTDMSAKAGHDVTFTYANDVAADPKSFKLAMRAEKTPISASLSATTTYSMSEHRTAPAHCRSSCQGSPEWRYARSGGRTRS
jgi:predicted ATP-binding protein involved in virulence